MAAGTSLSAKLNKLLKLLSDSNLNTSREFYGQNTGVKPVVFTAQSCLNMVYLLVIYINFI